MSRPKRRVGARSIHPVAFGGMNLSIEGRPDRAQAIATIHAALDAGAELIDTADAYALGEDDVGHNEALVREALSLWPGVRPIVATKGGVARTGGGWAHDGRPVHLREACEASLRALGVETIELYQLHAVDARVPIEESVGELARLREEGKIASIGVSNVSLAELERASGVVEIAAVQNEASPFVPQGLDDGVLSWCEARGVSFLAYAPTGGWRAGRIAHDPVLREVAHALTATPFEIALAWLLSRSPVLLPVSGASRPDNARSSMRAAQLSLSNDAADRLSRHFARREN